jgi:glycerol-3-phosphate dehydrogenase
MQPSHYELHAKVVINAAGHWSDALREKIDGSPRLRPLRGSHIIFSREKLPINTAVTMLHPRDNRAMFAIPWENRTMIGTTDLDHPAVDDETRISQSELDYLIEATQHAFPGDPVSENDVISTFSGLRPVINTNAETPSKESRAHKIWEENGLVTISGGKLTIFRVMAADVLNFCSDRLPNNPRFNYKAPCFIHPKPSSRHQSSDPDWLMMAGRLGQDVNSFFQKADPNFMKPIHPMTSFWAELAWAAEHEAVVHLDDLLLRRVRLGLLLPRGGMDHIEHVRDLVQRPLGWTDETWEIELERYKEIWQEYYSLPRK